MLPSGSSLTETEDAMSLTIPVNPSVFFSYEDCSSCTCTKLAPLQFSSSSARFQAFSASGLVTSTLKFCGVL